MAGSNTGKVHTVHRAARLQFVQIGRAVQAARLGVVEMMRVVSRCLYRSRMLNPTGSFRARMSWTCSIVHT